MANNKQTDEDNVPMFDSDDDDEGDGFMNNNNNNINKTTTLLKPSAATTTTLSHSGSGSSGYNSNSSSRSVSPSPSPPPHAEHQLQPRRKKSYKGKPKKLEHAWRFWHEKPINATDWKPNPLENDNLKELCEFDTIQDFWSCFNNLPSVYKLAPKDSFHLMKKVSSNKKSNENGGDGDENNNTATAGAAVIDSIRPLWEDPENIHGGEWIFRVEKKHAEDVWREMVLAVIGEQFSDYFKAEGDDICGLTVSARPVDYVFQLWHRVYAGEEEKDVLLQRVKQILGETCNIEVRAPYYKVHEKINV